MVPYQDRALLIDESGQFVLKRCVRDTNSIDGFSKMEISTGFLRKRPECLSTNIQKLIDKKLYFSGHVEDIRILPVICR